ncbi:hypothetical protein [Saliniramus sp.]|uniref:hypothetical protein n=1 Tax=Saliniramus sp. TaxID=2986772 RepID=UPI002B75394B|nr:hypothetical protein [Saliniramus sp.]HMB11585.1 hypothetical protein [Saliniramus sp.]
MRPDLVQVLLRVQTDLFAGAPARARGGSLAFESLALALIPRAEPGTLRYVARQLAQLPHTPGSVLRAIAARGQDLGLAHTLPAAGGAASSAAPTGPSPGLRPGGAPPAVSTGLDLALARDSHALLGERLLQDMVARARRVPDLAEALLARTDLPARSLAPLYLHADQARRAALRSAMAQDGGGASHLRLVRPTRERIAALHDAADIGEKAAFGARLAQGLGLPAVPDWRFEKPERHDCLALALLALGASEEDAIRIFLILDKALARDVATVFGLVEIFRRTPRSVACALIEAIYEISIALPQRSTAPADVPRIIDQASAAGRGLGATAREALRAGSRADSPAQGRSTGGRDSVRRAIRDGG